MIRIKGMYVVIVIIMIPILLLVYNFINNIITNPENYEYNDGEDAIMGAGALATMCLIIVILFIIGYCLKILSEIEIKIKLK